MDYRDAGVDISAADAAKDRIKALARSTFTPSVLTEIGSFGGMFRTDLSRYREPVLVASTDGVGTKIRVAVAAGVHDTVGYDLVAHCVDDILALPRGVCEGDVLLGLPSAGLHTNGYSLARKVLFEVLGHGVDTHLPELGTTVGAALLAPHRSYLACLEPLLERDKIRALAHITGGGFPGNLPRVLPDGLGALVRRGSWETPPLFRLIQKGGEVSDEEMYRTFNMGVGMVVVVSPGDLHEVEHSLERRGEAAPVIGSVVRGHGVEWDG
jgi:phosphoribosylformylglycinamidine cyclo-ligase